MSAKLCSALLLSVIPLAAAGLSGNWKLKGSVGEYPINLDCSFTTKGTAFSGTCKGGNRPDRAVTGEVNGQKVQFHYDVDYDGNNITVNYTGTLESDTQIKGTVETSGTSGEFTATKE